MKATFARTKSVAEAARAAGVSLPTAYRVLASEVAPQGFTARVRAEALRLYKTGLSCRRVAAALKATHDPAPSQETVFQWCRAEGILRDRTRANELMNSRLNGRDYDAVRGEVAVLAEEQLSIHEIARRLGVSRNFVKRHFPEDFEYESADGGVAKNTPTRLRAAMERRYWQAYLPDVEERRRIRDEVIARRERGETLPAIAAAVGKSPATVWLYCREAGLTKPQAKRRVAA